MSDTPLPRYDQATKNKARIRSLTHAVHLVTSRRDEAAIVPADHPERVRAKLMKSDVRGDRYAASDCKDEDIASWQRFRETAIGERRPEEITVAYLAGPEPANDLQVLLDLGLRPENIWAFEIDKNAIGRGLENIQALGLRGVKFIPASIEDYFVNTPRRFDIIYFDACGPFPSSDAKTTRALVSLFRNSALAPLGVLVTNFSRPDVTDNAQLADFSYLVAAYLYPKSFLDHPGGGFVEGAQSTGWVFNRAPVEDEGDAEPDGDFLEVVRENFDWYYGVYLTRSLIDIATMIAPITRLTAGPLYKVAFDKSLEKAVARGGRFVRFNPDAFLTDDTEDDDFGSFDPSAPPDHPDDDGDAICDMNHFSLLWTLAVCGGGFDLDENLRPPPAESKIFLDKWRDQLKGLPQGGTHSVEKLIAAFYAWRNDPALWTTAMQKIADFPFREQMPFLCDIPTSEIGFYPAFAQLAFPTHPNVREVRRFRYVAEGKSTPMYMDVIPFDECRYVYDWLSALHLVPDDWSDISAQLTFRFALDAMVKDARWIGEDFLYGCHSVGIGSEFPASEFTPREDLNASDDIEPSEPL